ncbi:hypothetical protein U5A82_06910 [Sphingobium sp. CR2-8]|uniref:hypothetical protein n=1 Tax=Sphingobium sp. CR2-8 TaxID=1306534 RepID=UPI002DBF18E4|nr:hypothetical protein [Sphingobium sp. CR2-8]MEC3910218.1 hypothetical protein [Sphingobium sp. CR2-8]
MIRTTIALASIMMLAACGSGSQDGVGGVSAGEAQALNDAAARLDAQTGAATRADPGLNPAAVTAAQANRNRTAPNAPAP